MPPTAAVRLRTAGAPPRCGKVKRPASSTVNLPVSRPLSCRRASTHVPRGGRVVFKPAALMPHGPSRRFPGTKACNTRPPLDGTGGLDVRVAPTISADRPDLTPPRTLARGRHSHRRHLGPTGAHAAHRSGADTCVKGSNAAVRSAESASGSTTRASCQSSSCPETGPCPASAALTTEPQPVHRLRIASLLSRSAGSASVCCATAAPRPLPPGASAPETLRLSRGLPCSSAACRGRALTPTSTNGTSSLRRRL